jgi:hypothetical protein
MGTRHVGARAQHVYITACVRAKTRFVQQDARACARCARARVGNRRICVNVSGNQYLGKLQPNSFGERSTNSVPHSPALVPQSKCLTAGLAVVVGQGLTSLVPQCPAMKGKLLHAGAHAHAHTRAHTRGRAWSCNGRYRGTVRD